MRSTGYPMTDRPNRTIRVTYAGEPGWDETGEVFTIRPFSATAQGERFDTFEVVGIHSGIVRSLDFAKWLVAEVESRVR